MSYSYAQDRVIKGRINSSDDGGALPGASITVILSFLFYIFYIYSH